MNETLQKVIFENSSNLSNITNITNYTSSFIHNTSSSFLNNSNVSSIAFQVDPNWFYSSSAQSAAAIVGLMGAFVTTKLLNTKSFVSQLKKEITEHQNKIDLINQELSPKIQYISNLDYETDIKLVDKFLDFFMPLIDPNYRVSLDHIYSAAQKYDEYQAINKKILEQKYNEDYLVKAREYAEKLVDEFLEEVSLEINPSNPPNIVDLLEQAEKKEKYKFIQKSVLEEKYNEGYLLKIKTLQSIGGLHDPLKAFRSLSHNGLFNLPEINRASIEDDRIKREKYRRYKDEVAEKKPELAYYGSLLHDKKEILLRSRQDIKDLRNNIVTLSILSITGIFLPLFMMLMDYESMMKCRVITFVVILFGWLIVILNLGADIWNIYKSSKQ